MRRPWWSKKWLYVAALPAVVVLGIAAFVFASFFRAQHSLDRASVAVAWEGHFPAELRLIGRGENPGFEAIGSTAAYTSGAFYQGKLYVSGPSGLFVFGGNGGVGGKLLRTYRVGLDLPAASLGAMAVGRLRGASEPELMIATRGEGVLVFSGTGDGVGSFRQIRANDADARDVTSLLPLATGELLIGTARRGVLVYRGAAGGGSVELESFHPQLANLAITALAADATGFWAGTRNHGVRHWHAGTIDSFEGAALPDEQVNAIAVHKDTVFVGTPLGVEEFDGGRPARVLGRNLFANALFADATRLIVGTMDEGIRRIALTGGRRPGTRFDTAGSIADGESNNRAETFLSAGHEGDDENDRETVYAIMRDGVRREQPGGSWSTAISETVGTSGEIAKLNDGNVSALAFDADGRLWIGYFDHGLDILTPASGGFGATAHREDDHLFCVNRIALDPRRQTMAVATANGLVLFDRQGKPRQVMTRRDGLIADHVTDVAFTTKSAVVATPAGLTFVDSSGARSLYAFQGLVNNHVYALGVRTGETSEILAGTLGGVSVLEQEAVERNLTTSNSGLKHNWVTAIVPAPDVAGEWMVGTYGAGIMRLDQDGKSRDGQFTAMDGATRSMVVNPDAMLTTANHVFAGTLGDGLWVWSRWSGRWKQVTAGLPSENVTALAEHDGEIYVGTENGLMRIAEHALE